MSASDSLSASPTVVMQPDRDDSWFAGVASDTLIAAGATRSAKPSPIGAASVRVDDTRVLAPRGRLRPPANGRAPAARRPTSRLHRWSLARFAGVSALVLVLLIIAVILSSPARPSAPRQPRVAPARATTSSAPAVPVAKALARSAGPVPHRRAPHRRARRPEAPPRSRVASAATALSAAPTRGPLAPASPPRPAAPQPAPALPAARRAQAPVATYTPGDLPPASTTR